MDIWQKGNGMISGIDEMEFLTNLVISKSKQGGWFILKNDQTFG